MPAEFYTLRFWIRIAFERLLLSRGLAVVLTLLVVIGPCACASQPPPLALAATRDTLAGLDEFGALLLGAGLSASSIPQIREVSPEQATMLRRSLAILPSVPRQYAPRFVADELLRYVETKGASVSRVGLGMMVQEYRDLFVLTPEGYLAAALTGVPAYCVGAVQVSPTSAGVGGYELGRYYRNSGVNWPQADAPKLDRN
ncbi:hypothetical protein [Cystobacter ferrugineus]|uniref:Uncharacterized protein n=1 Tax=Cystobacter ferrugineus TaxID=83449 RepID=A0A1L9BG15_9BACT|nr:hypothetical protein [Cystobacter ferrugineus]OJH41193.1 hypothetical protein BON30_09925 [Cystobacter ferrugineus]